MAKNQVIAQPSTQNAVPDNFKKAIGVVQVAMGRLGFLHRKIHNVLLANAQEGLQQDQEVYEIPASVIADLAGFESNDYKTLYDCVEDIVTTKVQYLGFDASPKKGGRKKDPGVTTLLADYEPLANGMVRYQFSRSMVKFLKNPDQFMWVALSAQRKFSSKYELGLYENCLRYIGTGSTGFKEVDTWRALIGATEPTYDEFKRLNTMVLKRAVKGVNEKSGIEITPEFEREKRKVSRIKFAVKEREQLDLFDHKTHAEIRSMAAFEDAKSLGLHELQAIDWIDRMGSVYVAEAVSYVQSQGTKVKNTRSYLLNALDKGYGEKSPVERKRTVAALEARTKQEQKAVEQARIEKVAQEVEVDFYEFEKSEGLNLLSSQSRDAQNTFLSDVNEGSAVLGLQAVRGRWKEVANDIAQLDVSDRTDALILGEISRKALDKWGKPKAKGLAWYCKKMEIKGDVVEYLKKSGKLK